MTAQEASAAADNGAMPGDSHVRIVRLSDVKGKLALDRKTGLGFEQTMQNMPIVQGERLRTADGFAEVEFEDNSTLRLAPNSQVDFSLLALRSSGAKASTMNVVKGTVYVVTESTKGNEFLLVAGDTKMAVTPSTHLRLEVAEDGKTVLSVFNGNVEVQHGDETTMVAKKESLTLDADQANVAKKVAGEQYDAWDKESNDYHQHYAMANTFAGGGNAFGLSDLNYYGSFINAGGFGSFWQPYFVGAGWSPYANGLWAMYPGAGYSWVSPYPWGWLPYHSGAWSFYPGYGWGWQPGGTFNGLNNIVATGGTVPAATAAGAVAAGTVHSPLRAAALPQAPAAGATRQSLVLANQTPIVYSMEDKPGNFVFQKDSAGLGVPRGSLGNLNKISNDVVKHGSASMAVYVAAPGGIEAANRGASQGPATLRPASLAASNNSSVSAASRPGGNESSTGAQSATASHSGNASASMGSGASMGAGGGSGGGGSHGGSAASPK
jgi:FecR protein